VAPRAGSVVVPSAVVAMVVVAMVVVTVASSPASSGVALLVPGTKMRDHVFKLLSILIRRKTY